MAARPALDSRLLGKRALVTGASRGLGRAIARAMWAAGASLALVARSVESLGQVREELLTTARPGQTVTAIGADLAKPEAPTAIVGELRAAWPSLDILVNNAAIVGPIGPTWECDWADWQRTMHVDLLAPVALCRAVVPWMIGQGGGTIINLSGGGATGSRPNFSAYAAAKTALVRFSEVLADELQPFGVRVNCVAPGAMNTAMATAVLRAGPQQAGATEYDRARDLANAGGASPERAADLCIFLASDQAAGLTGRLISAVWDPWEELPSRLGELAGSDIYTLRRIVPSDRGKAW
jgi:3-oxoacyl-[acyl-carrier protein] reductase